jgi:hypothetical protein
MDASAPKGSSCRAVFMGEGARVMGTIAWIISMSAFMGGLAIGSDLPFAHAHEVSIALLAMAAFSCPALWDNWFAQALLNGKQRAMACLALLLLMPMVVLS